MSARARPCSSAPSMCASIFGGIRSRAYSGETSSASLVSMSTSSTGSLNFGRDLLRIEDVKQDHFVAAKAQRLDGVDDRLGLLVEIGNHHHDAAPAQELLKMDERLGEIGARAELRRARCACSRRA